MHASPLQLVYTARAPLQQAHSLSPVLRQRAHRRMNVCTPSITYLHSKIKTVRNRPSGQTRDYSTHQPKTTTIASETQEAKARQQERAPYPSFPFPREKKRKGQKQDVREDRVTSFNMVGISPRTTYAGQPYKTGQRHLDTLQTYREAGEGKNNGRARS